MSTCTRCGTEFSCGMVDGVAAEPCWCTRLPPLPAGALTYAPGDNDPAAMLCFCPDCLRKQIAMRQSGGQPAN